MTTSLFVTGMLRSGTTLLDKLLSLHPRIHVFSQPLPLLYVQVKRKFLEISQNAQTLGTVIARYPLNDMFGAHYYEPTDFLAFLERFELSHEFCRQCLAEMLPFDGQSTKPDDPFRLLRSFRPSSLYAFVSAYANSLVSAGQPLVIGSKETSGEEYIPYFLACGGKVLQILRDPRDVITSLNYGRGSDFGGQLKPHLFNIRQWRKGVAFALAHETQAEFLAVRYEDLVQSTPQVMNRISEFLGLAEFPPDLWRGELKSQSGEVWRSNSSHFLASQITSQSVGGYKRHLLQETDRFVQATCFHEMQCLGYDVEIEADEVASILERHGERETLARPELAFYVWSRGRCEEEQERWRRLQARSFAPSFFIYERAFSRLSDSRTFGVA